MTENWSAVLELGPDRRVRAGSPEALRRAIGRGADLRIYTEFRHHEHIEVGSPNTEIVREVSDFRITYLVKGRWAAGIMNLRVPIQPPEGFGPRPSMSFFLYNEDGLQGIARPYLDGAPATGRPGPSPPDDHSAMPKYHQLDGWDAATNAPSSTFVYDFEVFRFFVSDTWAELFAHDEEGRPERGSLDALTEAFGRGSQVKVGISGLCRELTPADLGHEVFVHCGPCYYNTERGVFSAETQPAVRVAPAIPLRYASRNWDFGWLMPRTDGFVATWLCDPYTLAFRKGSGRHRIRWFAR
jgi:hypothetical protein